MRFIESRLLQRRTLGFQFSLWDSRRRGWGWGRRGTGVSILFMRFLKHERRRVPWVNAVSILFMRFKAYVPILLERNVSFNSLYEILIQFQRKDTKRKSFNSLYEIPGILARGRARMCVSILFMRFLQSRVSCCIPASTFQFSLWDSPGRLGSSSGLNSCFNSLYEIPSYPVSTTITRHRNVSILFMRFVDIYLLNQTSATLVSILFMRFGLIST